MTQVLTTLRVRPTRGLVLVNSAATKEDLVLIARFLSQVWGGRYWPILAVDRCAVDETTIFRLAKNRPDFVFGFDIDDNKWSSPVREACQPRHYVKLDRSVAEDVRRADRLGLIRADRAVITRSEWRLRPSVIGRTLATVSIADNEKLCPYAAFLFGVHPDNLGDAFREEDDTLEDATTVDLINHSKSLVEDWKECWLDATSHGLSVVHIQAKQAEPTIVLVRDAVRDLTHFWNLKSASDSSIPTWLIPIPEEDITKPEVKSALSEWLFSFQKYARKPNYCVVTSASISGDKLGEYSTQLKDEFTKSGIEYVDHVLPTKRLPSVVAYEYSATWPVDLEGQVLSIIPPAPKAFSISSANESWFVDILKDNQTGRAVKGVQLPESVVIPELLNAPCPPSFEHSAIPRFGDGVDSINFRCSDVNKEIHFYIPTPEEVLEECVREKGLDPIRDEKRTSYLPTIDRFGGLHNAAKYLSGTNGTIIEVLRTGKLRTADENAKVNDGHHQLILSAQGHALTSGQIKGIAKLGKNGLNNNYLGSIESFFSQGSERLKRIGTGRFRRHANRKVPEGSSLQELLEHLADNSILNRRWELGPCNRCNRRSYVGELDLESLRPCQHCGGRLQLKEMTKVAYSLEPSVRHSLNEGLATVALTGRFLENMTSKGFFWIPGIKYESGEEKGDLDLVACCDGMLIFGECKRLTETPHDSTSWTKTVDQFLRLTSVAAEFKDSAAVLSVLVDSFPDKVQQRIEQEVASSVPYLLLGKEDLDAGRRQIAWNNTTRPMCISDLLIEGEPDEQPELVPGVRRIDLGWSVYTREIGRRSSGGRDSVDS